MGWDDGDKNNPWQKNDRGPGDLDEIVRDFQRRLSGMFGGGRRGGPGKGSASGKMAGGAIGGTGYKKIAIGRVIHRPQRPVFAAQNLLRIIQSGGGLQGRIPLR